VKAAVVRQYGGIDNINIEYDFPDPKIAGDEVLIEVKATALNRADLFMLHKLEGPGVRTPSLPHIGGVDIAGVVAAVGPQATDFEPGDRVVVYPSLFCGECDFCRMGEHSMCDHYAILGEDTYGGFAEYTKVPERNLIRLPDDFPFEKAAAAPATFATAWRMLITTADLKPSDDLLVLGATGGVGTAAIQIARRMGTRVFATAGTDEKAAKLESLGVYRAINYNREDFLTVVREETGGRGVDVVADPLGSDTWRRSINSLKMGGRMVICGATTGDNPHISIREIYQHHRQILGAPIGNLSDARAVLRLILRGEIEPVIHAVLPLDQIREAHRILEERRHVGKVVVTI
jgi:NADPH:quinone reductase-like Zn-dependent oxidoreductase